MSTLNLTRLLLLLALLSMSLLAFFIFLDIIFPLEVEGNLTYTRIAGEPVSQITIYVPTLEGENIFKVYEIEATSPQGTWMVMAGPKGSDEYPDYWILEGPSLKPGETLQVQFVMKYDRNVNYEEYPWKIVADVEAEVPVTVYRIYLLDVVDLLSSYKTIISSILGAFTIALVSAALISAKKTRLPVAFYKSKEESGLVYQQVPECKEIHYVCLRFFIVDKCLGSRENPENKLGLLKNVKYDGKGLGELSPEATEKILNLIEDANKIWIKCCVRLVPCLDEENKPIFKAIDIGVLKPSLTLTLREPYLKVGEHLPIKTKVTCALNPCSLLEGREMKGCDGFKKSKVKLKITWNDERVEDPQYEIGKEVGIEQYKEWILDTVESYEKQLTDKDLQRKIKEKAEKEGIDLDKKLNLLKEIVKSYWALLNEGLKKEKDGGLKIEVPVDLFHVFNKIVDEAYKERCINVFVLKNYSDSWYKSEEAGFAETPGRGIFLDEYIVEKCKGNVLAHEVGHNLGLHHHEAENNVMHVPSGRSLTEGQCEKVTRHLKSRRGKAKIACSKEIELSLKKKREKVEKEKEKPKLTVPKKPSKSEKVKPPTPKVSPPQKSKKAEKIKSEINRLKEDIRRKEYLIKRNYVKRMREILKREFEIDEESLEGDNIDKWNWPEGYEEHDKLRRLRRGYYRFKKEIENLRSKINDLNRELRNLKDK